MCKNKLNKNHNNIINENNSNKKYMVITSTIVAIMLVATTMLYFHKTRYVKWININGDLVIEKANVGDTAQFIKYNDIEIIVVKASDGSIRTAFNTCEKCHASGRGYYRIEENELECQNCGDTFTYDQVSLDKSGCNPVPITWDMRLETDNQITIVKEVMEKSSSLFETWN